MPPKKTEMRTASVYYGDCVKHLEQWNSHNFELLKSARSLADLIYLDPPWNSNADYNILWDKGAHADKGFTAQETAFTDIWHWTDDAAERVKKLCKAGDKIHPQSPEYPLRRVSQIMQGLNTILPETGMLAYLAYMAERLAFCRELLKETGSIYLHCDPTMSHYLKLLMDAVFGVKNFQNEIVWKRRADSHNLASKHLGKIHDVILWYAKSEEFKYRIQYLPYDDEYLKKSYKHEDERGKYRLLPCTNETGGNRKYEFKGITRAWRFSKSKMEELYASGMLVQLKPGSVFNYKKYLTDAKGVKLQDLWDDIPPARGKERRGYPTQKPRALLRRIIQASTNPGDVVLDPFCGCGTTVVEAHSLGRQFVGIDISLYTVQNVVREWLVENGLEREKIHIAGIPEDMAQIRQLAKDDKFAFESFAVELCHPGFKANVHQRKDGGIDGKGVLLHPIIDEEGKKAEEKNIVIVQCKGGPPTIDQVRVFGFNIMKTPGVIAGVFITLEKEHWTAEMKKIASKAGKFKAPGSARKYPRLQHWHCARANLRNREETMFEGLPNLPDLAHRDGKALRKVEISVQQSDFWKGREE